MKKNVVISGLFLACFLATFPLQLKPQETVSGELLVKEWIDGQTITIFNHPVKRVFGETYDRNSMRNFHIPVTNIGYKDLGQLEVEIREKAKAENWPGERLKNELLSLDSVAKGGKLYVYIERKDNDRARANYFFVVFRDKNDKEFYRSNVEKKEPEFGDFGFWSNYFVIDIPKEVEYPFLVYVNDRKSSSLSDFKFEVLE